MFQVLHKTINSRIGLIIIGFLWMILLNMSYLSDYLQAGLPAGMDSSGHFAISQLYYASHWPALDGRLESYFQGFDFPRFYPPLFYQLCGALFYFFPETPKEILFKLLIIIPCLTLPGLVAAFYRTFNRNFIHCLIIIFVSSLLLSSDDEISRYMTGIKENIETGLCTQGLGLNIFIILLLLFFSKTNNLLRYPLIALTSAAFFLCNVHVTIYGSALLTIFFSISLFTYRKQSFLYPILFLTGLLVASPWYVSAWLHSNESPAVPVENFNFSQMLLSYVLISMASNLVVLVCQKRIKDRLSLFCVSSLIALPILSVSLEPLGLRLPWQPHRLLALHNVFLPLYIVNALRLIGDNVTSHQHWMHYRAKLAGFILLALFLFAFRPVKMQIGALSNSQSEAITKFNGWLSESPDRGYTLVAFSESDGWIDEFDIALSHYIALSGQSGLWSVFRESSFNSIQATALRNLISTKTEQWGIPNHNLISTKKYSMDQKLEVLAYWGVRRVIVRTKNYRKLFRRTNKIDLEYQDKYITSVRLKSAASKEFNFEKAVFFVSDPIRSFESGNFVDFAKLAEYTSLLSKVEYPVLLFKSCKELSDKMRTTAAKVACSKKDTCCTNYVHSPSALYDINLTSPIHLKIYNSTPTDKNNLVAAPWRLAREIDD